MCPRTTDVRTEVVRLGLFELALENEVEPVGIAPVTWCLAQVRHSSEHGVALEAGLDVASHVSGGQVTADVPHHQFAGCHSGHRQAVAGGRRSIFDGTHRGYGLGHSDNLG